jgi:hypothetical protein
MGKESPAYLDPQIGTRTNLHTSQQEVVAYFVKVFGAQLNYSVSVSAFILLYY